MPPPQQPEKASAGEEQDFYVPDHDDYKWPLLKDVIATPQLTSDLENIVRSVKHPEFFRMMGISAEKAFLFNGPPGTGKTLAVLAVRNQLKSEEHNVICPRYSIGRYGTAYINQGATNLQKYFDNGRRFAAKGYSILYFFDEADVLMGQRGGRQSHKEDEKILDTLMLNLQAIHSHGENEFVFFATNFKEGIDEAAIRAGRVDRVIEFPLPTYDGILRCLQHYEHSIRDKALYDVFGGVDNNHVADVMIGCNYADIEAVVTQSVRNLTHGLLKEANSEKKDIVAPPLVTEQLLEVARSHMLSRKPEKRRIGYVRT